MRIREYEVLEHSETTNPLRFVVFRHENGQPLKRAFWLGTRGGFKTWDDAVSAAKAAAGQQVPFMDAVSAAMEDHS